MAAAFPGMDPYLEAPEIWPDLHDALASEIRGTLNLTLPAPYYARLEMRPEVGIVEDKAVRRIVPDVAVVRHPGPMSNGGVAVLDRHGGDAGSCLGLTTQTLGLTLGTADAVAVLGSDGRRWYLTDRPCGPG